LNEGILELRIETLPPDLRQAYEAALKSPDPALLQLLQTGWEDWENRRLASEKKRLKALEAIEKAERELGRDVLRGAADPVRHDLAIRIRVLAQYLKEGRIASFREDEPGTFRLKDEADTVLIRGIEKARGGRNLLIELARAARELEANYRQVKVYVKLTPLPSVSQAPSGSVAEQAPQRNRDDFGR
jgi:hypothetical protein